MRVGDDSGERQVDDIGETSIQQVDGGNKTSHVDGGTRVSDTVGRDVDEQLGEAAESVWECLPPQRDWRDEAIVDTVWVSAAVIAARVELVCIVAEDAVADASQGGKEEAGGDTSDGAIVNAGLAESRVQYVVENWAQKNDAEGVEVGDDIVGHAVAGEHGGQEVGGAANAVVVPVLHGEEAEHPSGLGGTLDVLDELVVVTSLWLSSLGSDDRGLSSLPPAVTANAKETTTGHAVTDDTSGVWQIGTTWLVQVETGLEPEEQGWQRKVEQQWQQESQPPANVLG